MLAGLIANYLGDRLGLDGKTRNVVRFGAENLSLQVASLTGVVLCAWLLGCLRETLMVTSVVIVFRSTTGGAHLTAPLRCTVMTVVTIPALGKSAQALASWDPLIPGFLAIVTLIALVAVLTLAPVDSPAKPIRTALHRRRLRRLAVLVVLAVSIVAGVHLMTGSLYGSPLAGATALGLLWQSFMLTGPAHAVLRGVDRALRALTA